MSRPAAQRGLKSRSMRVADDEYASVQEGRIRIRIGVAIFMFALLIGIVRLAEISLFSPKKTFGFGSGADPVFRANIVDRNGELMATTLSTYALYARPKYIWNPDETADKLIHRFPGLDREIVRARITRTADQVLIKRGLTPREKQDVFHMGMPGLMFQEEPQRVYPRGNLASHVVGFADVDMKGLAGAEKAFNQMLSDPKAPDVSLSIDMRVQSALTDELAKGLSHFKAKTNAGIVLNIKTGEILAMASLPDFDPNMPNTSSPQNLYNHASMSTYELGSVFKPITMAMALEAGVTNLTETFPVQKPLKVRNKFIRDDHPSKVPLAMPEIMAESSNRGTAMMAIRVGGAGQQKFLKELGLMDRVEFELHESARPQVQSEWQDITTVTVSYGHGISVTPLALSAAVGALLNGGEYITPTILKRDSVNLPERRRVVDEGTSQTVRDLMRYVATNGTGRNARVKGYDIMGKTGTADKPSGNGYDERRLVSSFVSAFPYNDPTYLVFITYDEPKAVEGTYGYATAGWNATPTTGRVIERIGPMLGVPYEYEKIAFSPFSKEEVLQ